MKKREAKIIAFGMILEHCRCNLNDFDSPWALDYSSAEQKKINDEIEYFIDMLSVRIKRLESCEKAKA